MKDDAIDSREHGEQLRFETLLSDLSAGFINLPAGQVDVAIEDALRRICECLGLDVCVLWQWEVDSPGAFTLTHHYRRVDGPPLSRQLNAAELWPWSLRQILAGRAVVISSTDDALEGAERDMESFRHFGVKTVLAIPLRAGGGAPFGLLSFHDQVMTRTWSEAERNWLELIAEVIANAIARKRTEEALKESEARYRGIFDGAVEGMFRTSVDGKCLVANAAVARILGYGSAEEFTREIVDTASQIWAEPEERASYVRRIEKEGFASAYECQFKRRDGTRIWVSLSTRVVRGPDGEVACFDGFVEDISERKRREEALRAIAARIASAVDMAGLAFYEMIEGHRLAFVDDRLRHLLGIPPEEDGRARDYWLAHIHPDDCAAVLQASRSLIEGGKEQKAVEYRYLHPSRGLTWLYHLSRVLDRDAAGRATRLVGAVQDITERKSAEESLRESQERLTTAAELAGLGFYEVDDGESVTYADGRMCALCGFPPDLGLGFPALKFFFEHISPDDLPRLEAAHRQLNDGRMDRAAVEYRYLHPDRGEMWLSHLAIVTRRDAAGRAAHTMGVLRDVTELKRAEAETNTLRREITHSSRLTAMGQLSSSLAHELSQPLGAILRNAEAAELILQDPSPDLDEVREILADIRQDDRRAGEVIERMRAMMRKGEAGRARLDINALVREVVALVRPDSDMRRVRIVQDAGRALPPVSGDRVQLQQVLINLLLNAMDALAQSLPSNRAVMVTTRAKGPMVEIAVSDSGHGIPDGELLRIFEPFVTSKPNGLGLGLPISRSIVEAHHGRLRAENNSQGGATFTVELPRAEEDGTK